VSPLPDLCPFSFKPGLGSAPAFTDVALVSVLFMMNSSGGNESVKFETGMQHSSPGPHKSVVNKQVEKQSVRLAQNAGRAHLKMEISG
jgi:hypothetical protein